MNTQNLSCDLNCIWMTSELIKYKLCDKEFDCENCEFDKVIRNLSVKLNDTVRTSSAESQNGDIVERVIKRIENETFDQKIFYLKNQLVLKNLFGNAYYLGINPIVLHLLDDFSALHEFNNNEIRKDQIIFTLEGAWGLKQFVSPVNFMIIEKINFSQFTLNKWYAIILFNETDKDDFWISEKEWNRKKSNSLSVLKEHLKCKPSIGQSMMDGGEKIKYLHQNLGGKKYLELLNTVFK
ncbi:MAG TPA: hypothetical protein VLN45_04250 [Ignavibacteriaceae bacterium]|nr:hypothetical protein [Ignavibacteriaceae bacterium]